MKRVLDTNAVLYILNGRIQGDPPNGSLWVSVITEIELLGFPNLSRDEEAGVRALLAAVHLAPLTDEIKLQSIRVRREHRLRIPDAIIAATAIVLQAQLVTNDAKLLEIPGLESIALTLRPD